MSGFRIARLVIVAVALIVRLAFWGSHSSSRYDYTPSYAPYASHTPAWNLPSTAAPEPVARPELVVASDNPVELAIAKSRLRPVVAAVGAFQPKGVSEPYPHVMLGDTAAVGFAVDSTQIAGSSWLSAWKLRPADVLAIATTNLKAHHEPFQQVEPGVWSSPDGEANGASYILLVDEIRKLNLKGGPVAMIPYRGTLLLAGAKDPKALLAMSGRVVDLEGSQHEIHSIPLCLDGKAWHECVPAVTREVRDGFSGLATTGWATVYAHGLSGDDGHLVADLDTQIDNDPAYTFSTWTPGSPALLPKSDYVLLEKDDGSKLGYVPWERLIAVAGPHFRDPGHLPRYWATGEWSPNPAELRKLAPGKEP
jgi:hypothetical protein